MRHCAGAALLERQPRLDAVEGLNLAFLIDAQHQRFVGRVEIKPNAIPNLGDEVRVIGQFEIFGQMRLQAVRRPDALDAGVAEPDHLGELAHAPMRAAGGFSPQRHLDHLGNHRRAQRLLATR